MTTPAEAEATLSALRERLATITARQREIAKDRERHAFAAETGDADARAMLDALDAEDIGLAQQAKRLGAAVAEASSRLGAAQRVAEAAAQRAALALVPPITERLRGRAARLDALAAEMVAEAVGFIADVRSLHKAGFPHPRDQMVMVTFARAALASFMGSPLQTEHIAPSERHSFTELASGWTTRIDAEVSARMPANKAA